MSEIFKMPKVRMVLMKMLSETQYAAMCAEIAALTADRDSARAEIERLNSLTDLTEREEWQREYNAMQKRATDAEAERDQLRDALEHARASIMLDCENHCFSIAIADLILEPKP